MNPDNSPCEPDESYRERFTALFQRFASPGGARTDARDLTFLIEQLQVPAGAHLLCCPGSMNDYGWALTANGCWVGLLAQARSAPYDGAVWALEALSREEGPFELRPSARLAACLAAGARLVAVGEAGPIGLAAPNLAGGFSLLGQARSPTGRNLLVWTRLSDPRAST